MNTTFLRNDLYRSLKLPLFLLVLLSGSMRTAAQQAGDPARTGNSVSVQGATTNAWASSGPALSVDDAKKGSNEISQKGTVVVDPRSNFTFISSVRHNPSAEVLEYNKGFEQHPELGMLYAETPCSDCYELIDKRTETQKYFVKEGTEARKFVLYSSQYPLHYKDAQGRWMTVRSGLFADPSQPGVYHTKGRHTDVSVNTVRKNMTLTAKDGGNITYNNDLELVFIRPDGSEMSLGKADWSNYSAGDDGVRVTDAWPGIDIEMVVFANSVKTGFVIKHAMPAYAAGKLAIRDHMQTGKGMSISMPMNTPHDGNIEIQDRYKNTLLTFGHAFAYEKNNGDKPVTDLFYKRHASDVVDILVPGELMDRAATSYPLIIDPLVTNTISAGFTYSATLTLLYCANVNNLAIPAAATITDLKTTFSYYGPVGVLWNNSAFNFTMGGGACATGWLACGTSSSGIPGGTCGVVPGTSLFGTFSACIPAYNCNAYTLPVELRTSQRQTATAACVQTVYATATGFTMVVEGSAALVPSITPPASTTLCIPSTMTLTGSPASGVWSSSAPGVASVTSGGVVSGVSNGSANIILTASGCTATLPITVGTTPTITGPSAICFPGSASLIGAPGGGIWTSSAPGVATVVGGLVNAVSIGTTLISYNTGTCTAVRPFDVNSPTAVAPTTQPTGLVVSAPTTSGATINFTPNGSTGYLVIASTSPSLSATPTSFTSYATGSAFGGGIVVQGSASGSSPAYTTTLLNSNTRYYVFVFAFNNNCTGPQYNTVSPLTGSFNTCVLAPTGLTVTTTGVNSITISWTGSAVGGGYITPINYNVYVYSNATLTTLLTGYPLMAGTGTTYTISGLATGTQYWIKVAPADACNNMSNVATGTTICTAAGAITYLQTFEVGTANGDTNPNCMTSNVQNCVFSGVQNTVTYIGTINTNHTSGGTKFYNLFRGGACSAGWANQWLLLPRLTLNAGTTYTFSVWYRTDGVAWQTVRFQYSTTGTVPAVGSTVMGGTPGTIGPGLSSVNSTTYVQYMQTFTVPTTGVYYIGIDAESGGAAGLLAIDDIEVCAVPTITATNSAPPYCDPASVFLVSTGTSGATTYNWSGPAGYSSTLANPTAITGIGAGTYTYSLSAVNDPISLGYGGYCNATATTSFTVNPPPPTITGATTICSGQTTTMSNPLGGGTWSSSTPAVGTINSSGDLTGIAAGTTTITYNIGGCYTTLVVTVISMPTAITGSLAVCLGAFTTLNSTPAGGTWSSSVPAVGTVSTTGVVYGVAVGNTTITYGFSASCYVTGAVTVNANPTAIAGPTSICLGTTVTLTSTPGGGFWTSSASGVASVNILSGAVTGNGLGTANITYTSNGCSVWQTVTVVASPGPVVGPTSICIGYPTVTYTNVATGGSWSASNSNISIVGTSGVATGVSAGTCTITYSLSPTCYSTLLVTVLPTPPDPTGLLSVCVSSTTTLNHVTASGTWSCACPTIASVGLGSGVVTGIGAGTCIITYTLPSGCIAMATVTVNPNPGTITGVTSVCQGSTTPLGNPTPLGTWSSSIPAVGTISTGGVLYGASPGTTTISYTLSTGCYTVTTATVNPSPTAITGPATVCVGVATTYTCSPSPGVWGLSLGSPGIITGSGVFTGTAPGTAMITYSTPNSCFDTAIVTVLDTPTAITGPLGVCVGTTTTLSSTPAGGTWLSSTPSFGTISSPGGVAGGVAPGNTTITYTRANGCIRTAILTVNSLPITAAGPLHVCQNSTITLTATPSGGTWGPSGGPITVVAATGVVTGNSVGTATVTYFLGTGCITTTTVTVDPLPSVITGSPTTICVNSTTTLSSSAVPGGSWSSTNPGVGTVNTVGVVGGVSAGTTTISFTNTSTGCARSQVVTVNGLPGAITGASAVCEGQCTPLTDTPSGGTWSSGNTSIGTIGSTSGSFCGILAGTTTVTYTLPTGCYNTTVMLVNQVPNTVVGSLSVCEQSTSTLSASPAGGLWSSGNIAVGTIGAGSGILGGILAGTTSLTYTLPTTCSLNVTATVNPLPGAITGTLGVCAGSTTTLVCSPAPGTWSSASGNVSVVGSSGVVTGVNGGTTALVTYTLPTGCRVTAVVTVYALPAAISGTTGVCVNSTTTLTSTPGGTWSVANPTVGSINTSGVVTGVASTGADTTLVSYTNSNGCVRYTIVTVYALPTAITGVPTTCVGSTTSLNSTPAGGSWSSSLPSVATVGSANGVVLGVSGPLTTRITYTYTTGCITTQVVTVYSLPSNLTGPSQVCEGQSILLTSPGTPGGGWSSSNTAVATVDAGGNVTGVLGGTFPASATITYTLGTGCYKTKDVTVNPIPTSITGSLQICEAYGTTTLTGAPSGGTWSSSASGTAAVGGTSGVVTAGTFGTANITYTLPVTGCYRIGVMTVNQLPSAHTGPTAVCVNETVTLNSTPAGGTWSSPSGNVSVGASAGTITGVTAGTALISYANGTTGCVRTSVRTVNPLPSAILGSLAVCVNSTTALTDTTAGGTWASSLPAIGSISSTGVVSGITAGTTLVSYTLVSTGCRITAPVTVNQLPTPISGSDGFCRFTDATYASGPGGGIWTSNNNTVVSFADSTIGIAHGNTVGTTTITFTLPTGCKATKDVFTIFAPYPITGPDQVCLHDTIILADTIGGGAWSASNSNITLVPATSTTVKVYGATPGSATVTYVLSTGCFSTRSVTVNPIPVGTTGILQVCEGLTTDLDNTTPGGTWNSSDTTIATVGSGNGLVTGVNGGATGNTVTITYALGTGCNAQVTVTVYPLPAVITGTPRVCEGLTTTLVSSPTTGNWTSPDPGVATVGINTGVVSGISATLPGVNGPGMTTITYTLPTGCIRTQDVTVDPVPADITGVSNICLGDFTLLADATPGGSWISSNTAVATVDAIGVVTGMSPGNVIISYVLSTGCLKTWPMTVNDNPVAIGGSLTVCAGFATNLTSGPAGGVWSSDPSSNPYGTIHPITGVVSAITAGFIPVTYTLGSGCRTTATVTVINLPPMISGDARVCEGGTTTLIHTMTGGTWSISNPAIATVDASGTVSGILAGTTVVTYTISTGCFNILTVTVNPLPATITGPDSVCMYASITLMSATPGGVWASDSTHRAYVVGSMSSGVVWGVTAGNAQIRYTIGATGCYRTKMVRVDATPEPITGNAHICMGSGAYFSSVSLGGVWSISNPGVATLAPPLNTNMVIAVPVSLGSAIISYTYPITGCRALKSVTVQPLPVVYNVTGGGSYCSGGNGVNIGLDGSQPGVSYVLYRGATATGFLAGSGLALDFGLQTVAGTYTVEATNVTSGCQRDMAGSATVTIISPATPVVSINVSPTDSVCPGEMVSVTAVPTTGGTSPAYVWKVNGVIVATGPAYGFVPANGDVASVMMTSNATCLATTVANGSRTLTVLPMALPVSNVTIGPNDSVCQFTPVTLTAHPLYGGNSPIYAWYRNSAYVGSGATLTITPNNGDLIKNLMVSNYRCKLDDSVMSNEIEVYVEPMTTPSVVIYAEPGYVVAAGKPVKLRAVAFDAGPSPLYQWKVNGYPIAGATADTFTSIFNDYDSINCMVTSSGICGNIGTYDWVFITTAALGAQGGTTMTGGLSLHPNPNRGVFTVKGTTDNGLTSDLSVDITNMLGQVVYSGTIRAKQGVVDAQVVMDRELANGMYILTVHLADGKKSFHFVMEK